MPAYCQSCGYDLQGQPNHGNCPDCGEFFDRIRNKNVADAPPEEDMTPLERLWRILASFFGR